MYNWFHKTRQYIALLFVLTLLCFTCANIRVDSLASFAPAESKASISTDLLSAPLLPVSEAEIDKAVSGINHHGFLFRTFHASGLALFIGLLFFSKLVLSFQTHFRIMRAEDTDQFQKSIILYIHRKSDQS